MAAIPLNEKPYYNTDQIANSISADDMFDCYLEPVPAIGFVTRRRPGLTLFADVETGQPGDGLFYWDAMQKVIAVSAGRIFDIGSGGTATEITGAKLNPGIPVTFADGQDTGGAPWLYLANGKLVYTKGTTAAYPTDKNTPKATHVAWIKSRFVANEVNTNRFDTTDTNPNMAQKVLALTTLTGSLLAIKNQEIRPVRQIGIFEGGTIATMEATGGTAPYSWAAVMSTTQGWTINPGTGVIGYDGHLPVSIITATVTVTDDTGTSVSQGYTFECRTSPDPLQITSTTGSITVGIAFAKQLTVAGGFGPLTWTSPDLPTWAALSSDGILTGTPSAAATYNFTLSVTDSSVPPITTTTAYVLTSAAQPTGQSAMMTIDTATLSDATIGVAYTATIAVTGIIGTAAWTGTGLPEGLALSAEGVISGIPTGYPTTANITLSVTDSAVTGIMDNAYWSSVDNPLTCDAKGDNLAALFTAWQEIYAWGTQGLEIWQDDAVTPFSPIPGAFSEGGIEAPYSIAIADNTVFALCNIGGSRVVVKLQGRAPVAVSAAIARVLADMPSVSDAIGDLISVGGMALYILNFPTAGQTWTYDYQNDVWSRWGYFLDNQHERFIGVHACAAKAWGKHLIQSRIDGKIYELNRDVYDDAGNIMQSFRRTGWLNHGTYNRKRCDQFYVKAKCGQADNATMLLRFRDEGRTEWSQYIEIPLKPLGNGQFLAKMNRFGQYRSRQYEFLLTDNADLVLVGADVELTGMSS